MKYKLKDLCTTITDGSHFSPKAQSCGFPMLSVKDMREYDFSYENCKRISNEDFLILKKNGCVPQKGDVLVAKDGSYLKEIFVCKENKNEAVLSSIAIFRPNTNLITSEFLCYLLKSPGVFNYIKNNCVSGSALPRIVLKTFKEIILDVPDIETQIRICGVLNPIDAQIISNREINDNLLQQLDALYHEIFDNCQMKLSCPAGNYFDISIGKTPPRKEQWWFTSNTSDIRWVSISDMGNCGTYISNSSEYLTQDAVDKFNVVVVPDNTVILSFKLTVGRLAITDGDLTTNEAIAHFKTDNKAINPYLYFYLRNYKYETLGSTSSIATAVNSKIIKNMPFLLPHDAELYKFNELALPLMEKIKLLEHENKNLGQLRDSLLPKLMSGEIDVDSIEL